MINYFSFPRGLFPLQLLYLLGQRFDRWRRIRHQNRAPFPVICVGNFQSGGTGKTPVTGWLAHELQQRGYVPIILLRGYKSSAKASQLVESEDTALYGDEAILHARHFPTIVGKNRVHSVRLASEIATDPKTVLLMDDGLQHYELHKDFSIVCQKNKSFEHDTLLPSGRLREIPHTRIEAIVNTVDRAPTTPPKTWKNVPQYYLMRTVFLREGTRAQGLIICGIAQPEDFFYHVQNQCGFLADELAFSDHHRYHTRDLKRIERASKKYQFRVHCTAKDAVKLAPLIRAENSPLQLSIWDVRLEPANNSEQLLEAVVGKIEEVCKNRSLKGT